MAYAATMKQIVANLMPSGSAHIIRQLLASIVDRYSTQVLRTAGLVIHGSAGTVPKIGAVDCYVSVKGVLAVIAAATDMPVLVGTVVNATFNVFAFFIDGAGVVTSQMGTAGATLAAVKLPPIPEGKALVGFIIINPTGTGNFVGGTTALDDATVVPTTVYISPTGPYDPSVLIGT